MMLPGERSGRPEIGTMGGVMATSPGPATIPREEQEQRSRPKALDPYAVILYNDDVNSMDHVVRSLMRSVPGSASASRSRSCSRRTTAAGPW